MKIAKNKFDVLVFDQIFPLPQVRWSVIIINKHDMYDLTSWGGGALCSHKKKKIWIKYNMQKNL